jgi:hypothetical protein
VATAILGLIWFCTKYIILKGTHDKTYIIPQSVH